MQHVITRRRVDQPVYVSPEWELYGAQHLLRRVAIAALGLGHPANIVVGVTHLLQPYEGNRPQKVRISRKSADLASP